MKETEMTWDKIFIEGKIEGDITNRELCAIAYGGWACCIMGKAPDNFGKGMVAIGQRLGIPAIEPHLEEYARKNGWLKETNRQ